MMKSVIWWRKPEYPEETTDLRQVTDETFHTYGPAQSGDWTWAAAVWSKEVIILVGLPYRPSEETRTWQHCEIYKTNLIPGKKYIAYF